jgi:tRNA(adenine34) deaminase
MTSSERQKDLVRPQKGPKSHQPGLSEPCSLVILIPGWTLNGDENGSTMFASTLRPRDDNSRDLEMMRQALVMAREAYDVGEVPVGAIVVHEGRIISQAYNLRETLSDPTAHAERIALSLAGRSLGRWRLDGCTLYVTLEPCPMCAGAIGLSRIDRVVFGAFDPKAGACRSLYRLLDDPRLNHRPEQKSGVLADDCGAILSRFFLERRIPEMKDPRRGA